MSQCQLHHVAANVLECLVLANKRCVDVVVEDTSPHTKKNIKTTTVIKSCHLGQNLVYRLQYMVIHPTLGILTVGI